MNEGKLVYEPLDDEDYWDWLTRHLVHLGRDRRGYLAALSGWDFGLGNISERNIRPSFMVFLRLLRLDEEGNMRCHAHRWNWEEKPEVGAVCDYCGREERNPVHMPGLM